MLVLSVKSSMGGGGGVQTLGRRSLTMQRPKHSTGPASKPLSPSKSATLGRGQNLSYYQTLPHGLAITKNTASPRQNAQLFAQSLATLTAGTSSMGIASTRPPPPSLPPPQPPSSAPPAVPPKLSSSGASEPVPTATLITPASGITTPPSPAPSPSSAVMKPQRTPSSAVVCHAPLPQRSSLAGLSRPALQRIAMAQSRALIASG